jgi:mono/diheme cytochrome c family protein
MITRIAIACLVLLCFSHAVAAEEAKIPVLIVNGRNNHDWRATTASLKATLEATKRFEVSVSTAPEDKAGPPPKRPKIDDAPYLEAKKTYDDLVKSLKPALEAEWVKWTIDFSKYKAVIMDYNGPDWPKAMQEGFVEFVRKGGGVMLIHGANNAFGNWTEFNDMIGLGWRKGGFGKCLVINPSGQPEECCQGEDSGHGAKHPFVVTNRLPDHPVLRGMTPEWMHGKDELYHHMRGPAQNVTILASAFSDEKQRGSGRHEPVLYETTFGKGRVLTCTMGHHWPGDTESESLDCVGFQTIVARGAEYLATGKVSLPLPAAMPTKEAQSLVPPARVAWNAAAQIKVQFAEVSSGTKELNSDWLVGKDWKAKKAANEMAVLTPEEEKASFVLPDGFVAELVAAEPMIEEPVLAVWDGNGAMYVAEMRSYMQDEKGTGTKALKNGRIKRLTSSKGDGIMDKATVFVDGLNLPRMVLPLADGIAVVETDSTSVWHYRDTKGTGVADEKTLLFQGKAGDPNHSVEHQDSGLDWNLDNWIYVSYGRERYRFTDGEWKAEKTRGVWSQWGVTHDDIGRVFFSDNSTPALGFNLPRQYWSLLDRIKDNGARGDEPIALSQSWETSYLMAKNICARDDRGPVLTPGAKKVLTSLCGQSVFRGTALTPDTRGDYFFCDPTIHLVRRSKLENQNGRLIFSNADGEDEFMLSPDILFRPVNTATGPDGCLTVVDMYRGIIQDAPWLSDQPRKWIKESGLGAVTNHGRIWRIRHKDAAPTAAPHMIDEPTADLVKHLENPNGWWRDTAQKLIILRKDCKSIAPQLNELARKGTNQLARLHALWTLEGMGKADSPLLQELTIDREPMIRVAAIRISEPRLAKGDSQMMAALSLLVPNERDPEVAKQIILSLASCQDEKLTEKIVGLSDQLIDRFVTHEGVFLAACTVFWKHPTPYLQRIKNGEAMKAVTDPAERALATARWTMGMAQWDRALKLPKDMPADRRKLIQSGEDIFYKTCVSCHGADGKGVTLPGGNNAIAPALAGSSRVKGPAAAMVPALINGLLGPIEGKTYEGQMMVPATALGIVRDDRLAEVISFVRYAWGNEATSVTADEVKAIRKQHEKRPAPWTDAELKAQASE